LSLFKIIYGFLVEIVLNSNVKPVGQAFLIVKNCFNDFEKQFNLIV